MQESAATWEGTIAALAQRMAAVERELETLDVTQRERSDAVDTAWQSLAGWQSKLEACKVDVAEEVKVEKFVECQAALDFYAANKAAVGADCPWLAKGPATLEGCEAGCGVTNGCNAFNWNAGAGDCEWRSCVDPRHPQLTDFPGWEVYGNAAARAPIVIANAWHTDVAALAFLCDATPGCMGFNTKGKLTSNATLLAPAPGVTVFVKNAAPVPTVVGAAAAAGRAGEAGGEAPAAVLPAKRKPLPPPPKTPAKRAAERRKPGAP
jgi:hypothetical protein